MADEMSRELIEAMLDLNSKDWDDITEMWHNGQAEKRKYADQYYKQITNLNQGNRLFQEDKRMLTPSEKNAEIDQSLFDEIEARKEKENKIKEEAEALKRNDMINRFVEGSASMFSYNRLKAKADIAPPNKEKMDKDISEDFE